ncbi:MAG TPA: class I SAM-dependent methyltransferase [Chitinophagaceae bacterium]|nr:class I SAM-dependent methyltransferase [Chitinophagaceae bacterium]
MSVNEYFEANRNLWNQRTAVHKDSVFYDLAGFKTGANVLTPIELKEIGDVKDKSLLHLQCHFGMDTMSFSRMGAKCVGVDLSDEAIKLAREINDELKLDAKFICCNVYDLLLDNRHSAKVLPVGEDLGGAGAFDIVFTSYGTVGWLPDLDPWAKVIAERLKPGGFFYMAEFHPVVWMFDDDFTHIKYYYDNKEIIVMEDQPTYTGDKNEITGKEYSWNHSISEVLNALINAGLKIEFFNEYTFSPYANFKNSVETEPGKWHIKGMEGKIPMVYSLRARK